jgi:hypothetical protein
MALVKPEAIREQDKPYDTGLRIDTVDRKTGEPVVKAVLAMGQPGKPIKREKHRTDGTKHNHGWWPEEKKLEVATLFAALGSVGKVASLTKVPKNTVQRWTQEEWFLQTITRVRREENLQTDAKLSKIVDKALDKLMDRIETGDYVYDIKRGVAVQMPVSSRDLALVTGVVFDKRQLLRGEATKITAATNSEEHLKVLARKFEEYVQAREKVIEAPTTELLELQEKEDESNINNA